jgi:iron complex transport system substrate-binding protein
MTQRIATLLPSATEIVAALGLADRIVGVSHECDHPPEVVGRPVLTESKVDPRGSSAQIDAGVREIVRDGLSVYRIREAELRAARPDLIVTQHQCEVCAVSLDDVERAARALLDSHVEIVSLSPNRMDDVFADILRVARAAGAEPAGQALVAAGRARLDHIRHSARRARSRPRVVCLEWLDPLMAAGNWIPEMVEACGGEYAGARGGEHSPTISWDDLVDAAPDVLLLMPCGFALAQTRRELAVLTAHPRWRELPAVRNRRVYSVDGNAYMNRPGPRLVDSAEIIAALVQPGHFASLVPAGSYERVDDRN